MIRKNFHSQKSLTGSRQIKTPPGFNIRNICRNSAGRSGTWRIPPSITTESKLLLAGGNSVASPCTKCDRELLKEFLPLASLRSATRVLFYWPLLTHNILINTSTESTLLRLAKSFHHYSNNPQTLLFPDITVEQVRCT